jgi:hypothetical protein
MKRAVHIFIIASWIVAMLLLLKQEGMIFVHSEPARPFTPADTDVEIDSWRSIYMDGRWIGYIHTRHGMSDEGFVLQSASLLRFSMFNRIHELVIESTQRMDDDHNLEKFEIHFSGTIDATITGHRDGNRLVTAATYGGTTVRKTFDGADEVLLDQGLLRVYRGTGLSPGDTFRFRVLNPLTLDVDDATMTVTGRENDHLVMETRFAGLSSRSLVDGRGMVIREETPGGWLITAESKTDVTRRLEASRIAAVDILGQTSVPVSTRLTAPRSVRSMTLRITGYDPALIPETHTRQRFLNKEQGTLRIKVEDEADSPGPFLEADPQSLAPFLAPSLWIDSDDPAIRQQALLIVGDESDPLRAARLIGDWVYRTLEKTPTPDIPVATKVLKEQRGDCNEHTSLFIALARAAGIPADMSAGLVYLDDAFYYHAWPRVFAGTWIHMDPTFGQDIADAARIELVTGDFASQAQIALAIGRIGIEIIDYR